MTAYGTTTFPSSIILASRPLPFPSHFTPSQPLSPIDLTFQSFYYSLGASCYHHILGILPRLPLPAQDLPSLSLILHQVAEQACQSIALDHEEQSRCRGYHSDPLMAPHRPQDANQLLCDWALPLPPNCPSHFDLFSFPEAFLM